MVRERASFDGRIDDGTDRGVSEVIGSILVFGLVIALLAMVQTQVVPNANEGVEASHSAEVRGDMARLQSSISRSATLGGSESVTVETGMTYPQRLVLFNPPPVQGTLRTTEPRGAAVSEFDAVDPHAQDFLGSGTTYQTRSIVYRPDYEYYNAPTTTFEHTALVNRFEEGNTRVETSGSLVDGNRISLVVLGGTIQESSVQPASVTAYPVSAPAQTLEVESPTGASPPDKAKLTLPTRLSEETWVTELLADQFDKNALPASGTPTDCEDDIGLSQTSPTNPSTTDGQYVVNCKFNDNGTPDDPSDDRITLTFQNDQTYKLRTAKVGFSATDSPGGAYLTKVDDGDPGVLTVELHDKFHNPVGKRTKLKAKEFGPSSTSTTTIHTDATGRATHTPSIARGTVEIFDPTGYTPGSTPSASCGTNPDCVAFSLPPATSARTSVAVAEVTADDAAERVDITFNNTGTEDVKITGIRLASIQQQEQSGLTVSGVTGVSLAGSTTEFVDGPNRITGIGTGGSTSSITGGGDRGAVENRARHALSSSNTVSLPSNNMASGKKTDVSLAFDGDFTTGTTADANSVTVTVTFYFSDGTRTTVTQDIYSESGD